ncbi:MAG TPA: 4'-phosphopantetheinyl transferase superfamily protein [Bacteroides sp.]|nr:4'-phosphopantetheinyl transferase superfamily protein [Bacteroides sp.]
MGVILKNDLKGSCRLGIWEITEEYDELRSKLSLETEEVRTLDGFQNNSRKLEWLSVRRLINELTGSNTRIVYTEARKPYLLDNSSHISISHSKNYTAILMSKFRRVGIDMEFMSHKISNLADRFINKKEQITESPELKRYHLYIHWCAKEALYKICDKKKINFKQNLTIEPFDPQDDGIINGIVDNVYGIDRYEMYYRRMGDYTLVWTSK